MSFSRAGAPGWEFSYPGAVAIAGSRVWVANANDSVTEVSAATGALIRVISASRYRFDAPSGIAITGDTVWVASSGWNSNGGEPIGSVTEISARTGALIRVISASRYRLFEPVGIVATGHAVWVANGGDGTGNDGYPVTEISARTGALIRVISASRYRLFEPVGIAATRNTVWVANASSVTEISARTGALIRVISAGRYKLGGLAGIAATGNTVWAANNPDGGGGQTVTEINATTGALIRVGSTSSLPGIAFAITADRYGAWVLTNSTGGKGGGQASGALTEFSASTGALIRTLSQPILATSNGGGAAAAHGGYIWVTGSNFHDGAGWLAEFSARTGALIRQIIAGGPAPANGA